MWAVLGRPGQSWVVLDVGSPGQSWAVLGSPGQSWMVAVLGSPGWGQSWAVLGSPGQSWVFLFNGAIYDGMRISAKKLYSKVRDFVLVMCAAIPPIVQ